jgi:thiamine monophosphate synthase
VTEVNDRDTGGTSRWTIGYEGRERPQAATRFHAALVVLIPVLLALFIFAHGCHVGDHDDEPSMVPRACDPEPAR